MPSDLETDPAPEPDREASRRRPGVVFTPPHLARRLAEGLPGGLSGPVLDPACGEGALLASVLEGRARRGGTSEAGLFGLEIDPELAGRARRRLGRAGCPIDATGSPGAEIRCADALDPAVAWPGGTAILANPPWLSFSGRQAADPALGRERSGPGWPSLQGAFLERIARHVAAERTAARVLLPAAVAEGPAYGGLRRSITALTRLSRPPEELGEEAFAGVLEPAIIVTLVPLPDVATGAGSEAAWTTPSGFAARLEASLADRPRLAPTTFADPGVHTGNSAAALVHARPLSPEGRARSGVRRGRDLRPFELGPPETFLRTDLRPSAERRFRIRPLEHYQTFPILVRQTADRPQAALHEAPGYFRNSLLACRAVVGLDPAFVVAVLNGPMATVWHRSRFLDARQRAFPQVKVGHLRTQPFPIARRRDDARLHDEVSARVRALRPGTAEFDARCCAIRALTLRAFDLPRELEERIRDSDAEPWSPGSRRSPAGT